MKVLHCNRVLRRVFWVGGDGAEDGTYCAMTRYILGYKRILCRNILGIWG